MIESGNSTKAGLIIALQTQDIITFTDTLKKTKLDLNKFVDPGGFNIFHDFAKTLMKEYLMTPYLNILIEEFKMRHSPVVLVEMLNAVTVKEKQTPLHLAAKHNKLKLVLEFIRLGADPNLTDFMGQNVLHIAASTGNVGIFVYFYCTLMTNIYQKDVNSYTPLHLSVLEGHENMSIFIISISDDLHVKDNKGYTPLHLTVFSSAYKIARHLVMNGAERHIKCNYGQTAFELAISRGCTDMFKVLKEPGCITNPCKTPIKKIGKKRYTVHILWMMFRSGFVILFLLPFFRYEVAAVVICLEILTFVLFFIVSFKNPGYEKVRSSIPELYSTIKPDFICPYCSVKKIHTTVHCHHCRKCVRKFDHHCPWINNCIGENNHKIFVIYLLTLCLNILSTISLSVFFYLHLFESKNPYLPLNLYKNKWIGIAVSGICIIVILMILPLLWIQLNNIVLRKTTHDKYAYKKNGVFSSLSSTSSILLKDSEDWSYFSKKSENFEIGEEKGCCRRSSLPNLNQSSTINEEN